MCQTCSKSPAQDIFELLLKLRQQLLPAMLPHVTMSYLPKKRSSFIDIFSGNTPPKIDMSSQKGTISKGHESSLKALEFSEAMLVFRGMYRFFGSSEKIASFFGDVQPATTTEAGEDGEGPAPEMSRGGYGGGQIASDPGVTLL